MILPGHARRVVKAVVPPRYRWKLRAWGNRTAHYGTRRYCPCCDSHLRRFSAFGVRPRPDALCPVCGALERHRLASLFFRSRDELLCGLRSILHVAPEPPIARILRSSASEAYVSIDFSDDGAMVLADLTRMPFRSRSFDAVFCSHVLEHVPDDRRALEELYRILRPGGWALVQVPISGEATVEDPSITDPELRRRLFGQPDHVRVYGRDFRDRLEEASFAVSVERPHQGFDQASITRCGLRSVNDMYLCRKQD